MHHHYSICLQQVTLFGLMIWYNCSRKNEVNMKPSFVTKIYSAHADYQLVYIHKRGSWLLFFLWTWGALKGHGRFYVKSLMCEDVHALHCPITQINFISITKICLRKTLVMRPSCNSQCNTFRLLAVLEYYKMMCYQLSLVIDCNYVHLLDVM